MQIHHSHQWDVSVSEAKAIQENLRRCVVMEDRLGSVGFVGGVDVGFDKRRGLTRAAVAILQFPDLKPLEESVTLCPTRFPYVPGYLSFREVPAILKPSLASKDALICSSAMGKDSLILADSGWRATLVYSRIYPVSALPRPD